MTPLALTLLLAAQTQTSSTAPFSKAQLEYLDRLTDQVAARLRTSGDKSNALELKAEAYIKWLYRNNASQGCVTYGNPHPLGDNYSGDNGACPEFSLSIIGRPIPQLEGGFRLQTRYGQQFADYFENGDRRPGEDASSESLGQNHSAHLQLRGIYVRVARPLPLIDWVLAGSSDLNQFDAWTVGKVRFIERFNAKGIFLQTSIGDYAKVLLSRIALSKLYGTANYNSIEDPLLTNPFWARDAIYATSIRTKTFADTVRFTLNAGVILDEEADVRDPDAAGSVNTIDARDAVTAVAARFFGVNTSLTTEIVGFDAFRATAVVAFSHNNPNTDYVSNLALGGLGFSNVVYDTTNDVAGTLRVELPDLFTEGAKLSFEYFNIGADYNAVVGARREDDVLLTDGFLDGGQLPTLNLANELVDFNDKFYESIIGWHGGTALLELDTSLIELGAEGTFITYNTNLQDRDMDIYPGFGGFTGYTDTQLFSYANTNDRGRDPRAVYRRDQDRLSLITMVRAKLKPDWWDGAEVNAKVKYILDRDGRDNDTDADDYFGNLFMAQVSVGAQLLDRLSATVGVAGDYWIEDGRSGTYAGGVPSFLDYSTLRLRPWVGMRYTMGPLSAGYHFEVVTKSIDTTDDTQDGEIGPVIRSVGWMAAQF